MEVFEFKHGGKTTVSIDKEYLYLDRKGMMNSASGLRGEKAIRLNSISSVQLKKPGIRAGYIQFGLFEGNRKVGVHKASNDENSVLFSKKEMNKALEIKDIIEKRLSERTGCSNSQI
ncbi:DUF4429 domain-containing protein [Halobacillus sp. HZG1]|uniref:DUF4429 domain-containing protein n=1 Tax=Halobacillus sp. HZG1 TaxID=3111769 RepID=UPI002DB8BE91|nr:DUF4429 domain-containing protein [Halobacillus sp. HZG1]MEC3882639.1 DUF4429 domain-containing protein [Halobacillus sp. HZG1]